MNIADSSFITVKKNNIEMKNPIQNLLMLISLAGILVSFACQRTEKGASKLPGYDLEQPEKFIMPDQLLEISGIAFHDFDADTVFSIQDEDGRVFKQHWGEKKQSNTKFGSKGDYEDIAIIKETVFVLKSNGTIYTIPFSDVRKSGTEEVKEFKKILPKGEYESLYASDGDSKVYVLCKNCKGDGKKQAATGYIFNFNGETRELEPAGNFSIDADAVEKFGDEVKGGIKASALGCNPATKEWYIVSSVNKMLIVTSPDWTVKSVHHLDSGTFNQPEGIAFDKNQNLYISNEGDEISNGNILKFKYQPSIK
jgi:uncharacterized protein YjiK